MKNSTKTTETPATHTPTIDIAALTPEQLAALNKQFKAQRKAKASSRKDWLVIVDRMLHETDGDGFKNTTGDILAALVSAKLEPANMPNDDRAEALKRIQTRKQAIVAKLKEEGKPINVGYKVSAAGFALTPDRVIAYLKSLDASQRSVIYTALGVKV